MSFTLTELATRVLKDLGLIAADETPSADDAAWAEETCTAETAMLAAVGIPVWGGSEASVPPEYLTTLSRRIGLAVAPSFGLMDSATAQLAMREAERYLTLMANPRAGIRVALRTDDATGGGRSAFNFTRGY
jgi:hypothetical protein